MNYFTSKTAEQLTLVSISHAREGKAGELKKPVSTSSKRPVRKKELSVTICMKIGKTPVNSFFMKYGQTKNFGKNIPKVNICKLFGPAETN